MSSEGVQRRLAAIFALDVVGYSRLMATDEEGTLARLRSLRANFVDPTIATNHGRIVKLMGDGTLVEFASVVDAVRCAVDIQRGITERETDLPEDQRIRLRIGVNLGDVIIDGDDIYGDGVNVAARLEGIAESGGIVVSGTAFDHAHGKTDVGFANLGLQVLKNIPEPVRAYTVRLEGPASNSVLSNYPLGRFRSWKRITVPAAVIVFILAISGALWWQPWSIFADMKGDEWPALPLPAKPSIAVLPLTNMSDDSDLGYFIDGMTDDLITHLARYRELFVISRNSSFLYRGDAVDVKQVGRELGVAYVMEGSIRRESDRIRVNVQLIDARTGDHVWAEIFDRELEDTFALQDEITGAIAGQVAPELFKGRLRETKSIPTTDLQAWDLYLQAFAMEADYSPENMLEAIRLAQLAIDQDSEFAAPHVVISRAKGVQYRFGWTNNPEQTRDEAVEEAKIAIRLDGDDARAYAALGYNYRFSRDKAGSLGNLERAVELNPNDATIRLEFAHTLDWFREQERALPEINEAIRLSPRDSRLQIMYFFKAHILFHLHRYEDSLDATRRMSSALTSETWRTFYHQIRAVNFAQLGRAADAKAEIEAALDISPTLSLKKVRNMFSIANNHPENRDFWVESLQKAGMPEG